MLTFAGSSAATCSLRRRIMKGLSTACSLPVTSRYCSWFSSSDSLSLASPSDRP